jgi:hypothetical protein
VKAHQAPTFTLLVSLSFKHNSLSHKHTLSRSLSPPPQMHNGCFPGTSSAFANMCHSKMVRPAADLVFVEYVTNDFAIDSSFHNVRVGG